MIVEPYLFFGGRCEEAIEFYRKALGAETTALMRYSESPEKGDIQTGWESKIMHANLRIGEATIMVSDGAPGQKGNFQGFALTISLSDEARARKMFQALAETGETVMPLCKTFYSPLFGMITDRFGVLWMIMVTA